VRFTFFNRPLLIRIIGQLDRIEANQAKQATLSIEENIMSEQQDLAAAVQRLNTSTSAELKAIADKLSSLGDSVSAADVAAAVASINSTADALDNETATLTGAAASQPATS
jgi:hypothetical protein